jgi:dimethylamine---corrinoid protein Co-methyltransferase
MASFFHRLGDGSAVEMSAKEIMAALVEGSEDAAERGRISPLNKEEYDYLLDIFCAPYKFISVEPGREVILTYDAATLKIRRVGVHVDRIAALQIYEKIMGADTMELAHVDYSFKPVKPIAKFEQPILEQALLGTHIPLFYGAQPNLGLYSQPDGPFPNPAELMPMGKIAEAQASYEASAQDLTKDIVYTSSHMVESGADGINLDTTGSAGDADFLATLLAAEKLKAKYPDICIEIGMSGEFVLGMHSQLTYKGEQLAGMYPHQQVKMAEAAGATIFGPVCNTNTSQSAAWNLARAVTFMKACCEVAKIPVHPNMGMGVGGVTVNDQPPVDVVSRSSAAMTTICRLDGL